MCAGGAAPAQLLGFRDIAFDRADALGVGGGFDAELAQHFGGDGAGGDAADGFAARGAAAAAVIAQAVLGVKAQISVAGAVDVGERAVVFGALVFISDEETDGGAGRAALEDAGQDRDGVLLAARGRVGILARAPPVEAGLDVFLAERQAGRASVDDGADPGPVAFAPGGDSELIPEG